MAIIDLPEIIEYIARCDKVILVPLSRKQPDFLTFRQDVLVLTYQSGLRRTYAGVGIGQDLERYRELREKGEASPHYTQYFTFSASFFDELSANIFRRFVQNTPGIPYKVGEPSESILDRILVRQQIG